MTWGKAIVGWNAGPAEALADLIDLNHRYALDGSDPNSYGGLLWCLGVLDRPFDDDQPVTGALRSRPLATHARRIDLVRYETQVRRTSWNKSLRVAVVGGGIAGLAAARTLADHNAEVVVLDEGRRPGGRASTRLDGEHTFDHGAQYFTARDERFVRYVRSWIEKGLVAPWKARIATIDAPGALAIKSDNERRYVGVPRMAELVTHLADTVGGASDVRFGVRVSRLERDAERWVLSDDHGDSLGVFDAVILGLPAPQAAESLGSLPDVRQRLSNVAMAPCWAGMLAFAEPVPIEADGVFINIPSHPLSWTARDSSKPGRPNGERWVVHAGPEWSAARLNRSEDEVCDALFAAFAEAVEPSLPAPTYCGAHLWRYAFAVSRFPDGCVFDAESRLAVAGDWCNGGRIEGAFLSGVAAAGRLLGEIISSTRQVDRTGS
jgi:predicted NAD/FAD-dependent oxidoreductase